MRYSIRFKLFAALICLILFFVMLSWILNSFFLERYYFYKKENMLRGSYNLINDLYKSDSENISLELEKLERMQGLHIIITDSNFDLVYNSMERRDNDRPPRTRIRILIPDNWNLAESLIRSRIQEISNGETIIETREDRRMNSRFISLFSKLANGDIIFLSTPVAAIEENVQIANNFFLFTGIITILAGSIFIFLITGKFTNPILELNTIAQKMTLLDFSARYPVKTKDEIGQLGGSINSLSDQLEKSILELRSANEQLMEDIERKMKIDEMRKEFVSSVSHELKTPIALIQGYAEGLRMNVNEDEENKNFYCEVIVDEALKMNKLVKQLLELSQMEAGEFHLEKADFKVCTMINQVLRKNELVFKEKGISVSVDNEDNYMVNADYDRTELVIINYLTNAVNHVDDKKIIRICVKGSSEKVTVSVFNSGEHLPVESYEKIWTSFYKIDKARTREYGGSGLGLSIVKAVLQAHKNRCGVKNVEGGVEFWFELDRVY